MPSNPAPKEIERWLWAHAAGLLEPEEQAAIAWHLAHHPEARQQLAEMRSCFDTVAARRGRPLEPGGSAAIDWLGKVESFFSEAARRLLDGFEECVGELAAAVAVVAVVGEKGLLAQAIQPGWTLTPARSVVLRGSGNKPEPESARGAQVQEGIGPGGTRLTLVQVTAQEVDILVETPDVSRRGVVELRRITKAKGGPKRTTIAVASLEEGRAEFRRCKPGLLEIQMPETAPVVVGIAVAAKSGGGA